MFSNDCIYFRLTRHRTRTVCFDPEEAVKLAIQGHPRGGQMSERLLKNIENFILKEIMNLSDEKSDENSTNGRFRSMSLIPRVILDNDLKVISKPPRKRSLTLKKNNFFKERTKSK